MNSLYILSLQGWQLRQFQDILFYLCNNCLNIEELNSVTQQLGVINYIYFCLFYTNLIYPNKILLQILTVLERHKTEDITGYYGLNEEEKHQWQFDLCERLLDPTFPGRFYQNLSEKERQKVQLNFQYM